jgi:peptidoglycan/xylan/chitin deacetylase (PgdA/CDA1 family)
LPFRLYLIGEGPLRAGDEEQVANLGLGDAVTFVGGVAHSKLVDWYRAADVTTLPSRSEGVPNVLRESLACGTPFVASRVGGIAEIMDERTCLLVPPEDPSALADALERAVERRDTAGTVEMRQGSWDDSAAALEQVLERLCAVRRAPSADRTPLRRTAWGLVPTSFKRAIRTGLATALPGGRFMVRGPAKARTVCLTFDDGPPPAHRPRVLDLLAGQYARASFFMVGREAERFPDLVKRVAAEGHAIGGHSWTHGDPFATGAAELAHEAERTERLFERLLGRRTRLFRPPHGKLTAAKAVRLLRSGQRLILWNVDPNDFASSGPGELAERLRGQRLRGGDLVLLHDNRPHAIDALPAVIDAARQTGLGFGTVADWLGRGRH